MPNEIIEDEKECFDQTKKCFEDTRRILQEIVGEPKSEKECNTTEKVLQNQFDKIEEKLENGDFYTSNLLIGDIVDTLGVERYKNHVSIFLKREKAGERRFMLEGGDKLGAVSIVSCPSVEIK